MGVGATALGNAALAIEQLTTTVNTRNVAELIDAVEQAVAGIRIAFSSPIASAARNGIAGV